MISENFIAKETHETVYPGRTPRSKCITSLKPRRLHQRYHPVPVVDVFVDELDLAALGFDGAIPAEAGRPAYHPAILLKI